MKKLILALLAICLLSLLMAGCKATTATTSTTSPTTTQAFTTPSTGTPSTPTTTKPTTSTTPASIPHEVTITDTKGRQITLTAPANRIVSITNGASEIICAFGAEDKIVGRDSYSTFPSSLLTIPEVAGSSYDPNLELIFQAKPDIVIGDTMLQQPVIDQLTDQGIPVVVDSPSDPARLNQLITNIGLILDKKDRTKEIIDYINGIREMVAQKINTLTTDQIPTVFYEWYKPYYSASAKGVIHQRIVEAGGNNIAANEEKGYPQLSAEWVMQKNPQIILSQPSTSEKSDFTTDFLKGKLQEIMARPELANVDAIKQNRVYVLTWDICAGMRFPVGIVYMAKWFHPDLFEDIDPVAVHQELVTKFFGAKEWEELQTMVFAYP